MRDVTITKKLAQLVQHVQVMQLAELVPEPKNRYAY